MILQALTEYYQALEREGKIAAPGLHPRVFPSLLRSNEPWAWRLTFCVTTPAIF